MFLQGFKQFRAYNIFIFGEDGKNPYSAVMLACCLWKFSVIPVKRGLAPGMTIKVFYTINTLEQAVWLMKSL
jgi:hypothetical protein